MNEEIDQPTPGLNEYDKWFKDECIPLLQDKALLTLKHVEKLVSDQPAGHPDYFASFTVTECLGLAADLSYGLVMDENCPLSLRRSSLHRLIQLWPIHWSVRLQAKNIDVKGILNQDDDNFFSLDNQVELYGSLVWSPSRDIFGIDFDFLASCVAKTWTFMGMEEEPDVFSEEKILLCVKRMKGELRRRASIIPED